MAHNPNESDWGSAATPISREAALGNAVRWSDALAQAGKGNREAVVGAVRRWNPVLRECLRAETRFSLGTSDDRTLVPVKVVDGLPVSFEQALRPFEGNEWLLLNKLQFEECLNGTTFIQSNLQRINQILNANVPASQGLGRRESVDDVVRLAKAALGAINAEQNLEKVFKIEQDVLGAYFYRRPEIQIYWMAISIIGLALAMPIESLTIVVLAHELAHAYMHLGRDIDEDAWDTNVMVEASSHVVEGLAQYYSYAVCSRLESRHPAAVRSFATLVEKQTGPYRAHEKWTMQGERAGEAIRAAAIDARKRKIASHDQFMELLNDHRKRLQLGPLNSAATGSAVQGSG